MECTGNKKHCPFKIIDIENNVIICHFYKKYWEIYNSDNTIGVKLLLNRACKEIREYELFQKSISKLHQRKTIQMLKNIIIGDTLYWVNRSEEVKLIERPSRYSMIERCKCQRYNNDIVEVPAYLLRAISKGTFCGECFINEEERKIKELQDRCKYYGFRAQIEKKKDGFLLKIYGDSQQEVDDFINLYIRQDFTLLI